MSWCEDNLQRPEKTSRRKATRAWRTMDLVGKPDHKGGPRNLIAQVRPRDFFFFPFLPQLGGGDGETPGGTSAPAVTVGVQTCPFINYYLGLTEARAMVPYMNLGFPPKCDSCDHEVPTSWTLTPGLAGRS